jgi:hypothetical protein
VPSIHSYVDLVKLILSESAKYFALLVLVVLAVRFWRRLPRLSGTAWRGNFLLACLVTLLSAGVGHVSFCHSMSLMYWHFGLEAFHNSRIDPAFSLFDTSWQYRKNADALGGKGVCLLVSGRADAGLAFLDAAKAMRHGRGTPFEDFYQGWYYFYANDPTNAVPPLEAASADLDYTWEVTKFFAVIQLDRNQPQEAARLMQPYLQAQVSEPDHAYIMARLNLANGRKAGAQALVDRFSTAEMAPFWRARFEQLKAALQNGKT